MKKMNNKGFAISTLLYGLMLIAFLIVSVIMSVMSTNRKNTSTLVKKIEEELNRYSQTATEFTSTDGAQEFIVPYGKAGWYKIELWGAAAYGVTDVNETESGRGSYTAGLIYLEENQHLYFFVGTIGTNSGAVNKHNISNLYGGGATDVRLIGGGWDDASGKGSRIMVAGGGGHSSGNGSGYDGGFRYNSTDGYSFINGQAGIMDKSPSGLGNMAFLNPIMFLGVNSGQGRAKIELVSDNPRTSPPGKKTSKLTTGIRYVRDCAYRSSTQSYEYWTDIQVIDSQGRNVAFNKTIYYGTTSSLTAVTGTNSGAFTDMYFDAVANLSQMGSGNSSSVSKCIAVDLGSVYYDIEEIAVFHSPPAPNNSYTEQPSGEISISATSLTAWSSIKKWNSLSYSPFETGTGLRISDRNPETTQGETIATGNYYIVPARSENRVVAATTNSGVVKLFTGDKDQKWAISLIDNGDYKVVDAVDQWALQPAEGGQEIGEPVAAISKYNAHAVEKWEIEPVLGAATADPSAYTNNGYYIFRTGAHEETGMDLCLATQQTATAKSGLLEMKTCNKTDKSQWFKLVNADY